VMRASSGQGLRRGLIGGSGEGPLPRTAVAVWRSRASVG
jgi:hypothetical protein